MRGRRGTRGAPTVGAEFVLVPPPVPRGRQRGLTSERGTASGLVAAGLLLLSGLVLAGFVVLLAQTNAHRVQGAADLVALTGARARLTGSSTPCAAATRAADADGVHLVDCQVAGGPLEFVVTVTVRGGGGQVLGMELEAEATARAGLTDGG